MILLLKKKNSLPLHCYTYFSKSNAIFIHEIDKLNIEENKNRRANSTTYTFKSNIRKRNTGAIYKPTWISFRSFCFLSRMVSRSCCSSGVRSVITNIQEELEVIAWFHWPGGSGPITSSLLLNPHQHQTHSQTMINTCIQHAKTQTEYFSPLLDQSSDAVCHTIPSTGCMSNKNC